MLENDVAPALRVEISPTEKGARLGDPHAPGKRARKRRPGRQKGGGVRALDEGGGDFEAGLRGAAKFCRFARGAGKEQEAGPAAPARGEG